MAEINKTEDRVMLEVQINPINMTYDNLHKQKEKFIELSGNIMTDKQTDLSSPTLELLENNTDFQSLQKGQVTIEKDLGQMVKQVKDGNMVIKRPHVKHQDFDTALKRINKWMSIEKTWTFVLLGLAIIGACAFVCNLFVCKHLKHLKSKQSSMRTEIIRRNEEGHDNHGFDPKSVAASLIAMTNLGQAKALEVTLANDNRTMDMHVVIKVLDIVYLILMHAGCVLFLYILTKIVIWMAKLINENNMNKKACNSI